MSWGQKLVNAQVSVNRSVFEMNRPGYLKTDSCYKKEPDLQYIIRETTEAVKELQHALTELKKEHTGQGELDLT